MNVMYSQVYYVFLFGMGHFICWMLHVVSEWYTGTLYIYMSRLLALKS